MSEFPRFSPKLCHITINLIWIHPDLEIKISLSIYRIYLNLTFTFSRKFLFELLSACIRRGGHNRTHAVRHRSVAIVWGCGCRFGFKDAMKEEERRKLDVSGHPHSHQHLRAQSVARYHVEAGTRARTRALLQGVVTAKRLRWKMIAIIVTACAEGKNQNAVSR